MKCQFGCSLQVSIPTNNCLFSSDDPGGTIQQDENWKNHPNESENLFLSFVLFFLHIYFYDVHHDLELVLLLLFHHEPVPHLNQNHQKQLKPVVLLLFFPYHECLCKINSFFHLQRWLSCGHSPPHASGASSGQDEAFLLYGSTVTSYIPASPPSWPSEREWGLCWDKACRPTFSFIILSFG